MADSTAWIAFYRQANSIGKNILAEAIQDHTVLVPDVVLLEVLRGIDGEKLAKSISAQFENYQVVTVGGKAAALQAAEHFRFLRSKSVTIRGSIDLLIATWCLNNDVPLIHADRDFDKFETYLDLKIWRGSGPLPELV